MAAKKKANSNDKKYVSVTTIPMITRPPAEIPEVAEFEELDKLYQHFKVKYAEVLEPLAELAARRSAALEAAMQVVRRERVQSGSLVFQRPPAVTVDADALIEQIGIEDFTFIGGTKEVVVKYHLEPALLEKAVAEEQLDPDVAKQVVKVTCYYRRPKEVSI